MAVRLAKAGHDVSVIARGPHLAAIRSNGLKLVERDENGAATETVASNLTATDRIRDLDTHDVVLLALKAHQIAAVVDDLPAIVGPETCLVTLQNGIPWWYFQKLDSPWAGRVVETVDPGGVLFNAIDPDRIIGCIAYPAATLPEPGVIRHIEGNRFPVGELDNSESERLARVSALFAEAGFKSRVLTDIRSEIWLKLWGNLTFNPISALTHATLVDICQFPATRSLAAAMMTEAQEIGERLGATFRVPMERRIAGAEGVGKHKTSMLQDVEVGKPLEIDGMLGAVIELAEMTGVEVPTLRALYACVSLLSKTIVDEGIRVAGAPR
ncbi:MAG: 2-dehydropantoate 2-reductase [Acidobacteria bacterium]|nr:2-dehydropantoate 2-reductase [Acidobacteriota bacterium]MXZ72173.1 2-dehydropantoate 2-reductase [Acidobacteriota bacterium]MYJ05129.1 2-dehydropantoate 2-reductase [Acidobacteriota bacterium]